MQNQNKFVGNSLSLAPPPHHFGIAKRKVMGSKLQVTPTKLQVTLAKLQVTPTKLQVTLTKLQVTQGCIFFNDF